MTLADRSTASEDTPVFGRRAAGASYVVRPSAYAVITNADGQLAIARTAQGVFLPGGGVEAGETAEQAVRREVMEECGLGIRLLARLPGALQLVYAEAERTHFEKVCEFIKATVEAELPGPTEKDCTLSWVAPGEAELLLAHESHRWAVRRSSPE